MNFLLIETGFLTILGPHGEHHMNMKAEIRFVYKPKTAHKFQNLGERQGTDVGTVLYGGQGHVNTKAMSCPWASAKPRSRHKREV